MLKLLNLITLTSLLVALSPCIAFGQYASKSDRLQTNSGLVAAELKYLKDENTSFLSKFNVQITRNNKIINNSALPVKLLPYYDKESGVNAIGVEIKVIDLNADREPEVLIDLAEAGAHCCSSTFIYSYDSKAKQYNALSHFWGNYTSGYWLSEISGKENDRNLADLNKDGSFEFLALDDRFRGEFGGYALSAAPVQVWRYQQAKMKDVTKEFPQVVYQSATDSWQMYSQIRQEYGADAAQGAMAAYVASKFILGQKADAIERLRQAYSDHSGQEFISKLISFLAKTGYAR